MKSFFASLRMLVLPFGATSGRRIVLNGVDGFIEIYDTNGDLRARLGVEGLDETTFKLFTADAAEDEPGNLFATITGLGANRRGVLRLDSPSLGHERSLIQLLSEAAGGGSDFNTHTVFTVFARYMNFRSGGVGGEDTEALVDGKVLAKRYEEGDVDVPASIHSLLPLGMIVAFGGTVAPSSQWLLCDGAAVSRTTYAALFTAIGTAYGAGDGSTTFNLPNLQQRFPLGKAAAGTGSTLGGTGGSIDHTHAAPAHSHSLDGATGYAKIFIAAATPFVRMLRRTVASWDHNNGAATNISVSASAATQTLGADLGGNTSSDGATTTDSDNPPFQTVNYLIRALP